MHTSYNASNSEKHAHLFADRTYQNTLFLLKKRREKQVSRLKTPFSFRILKKHDFMKLLPKNVKKIKKINFRY